jgi:hypothetical protein
VSRADGAAATAIVVVPTPTAVDTVIVASEPGAPPERAAARVHGHRGGVARAPHRQLAPDLGGVERAPVAERGELHRLPGRDRASPPAMVTRVGGGPGVGGRAGRRPGGRREERLVAAGDDQREREQHGRVTKGSTHGTAFSN